VIRELTPPDTALAFRALRELRPAWTDKSAFVRYGPRYGHSLAWGHYLYIDDLSTLPAARGRGPARGLLDWLRNEAGRRAVR
jgi:hypothetical protein